MFELEKSLDNEKYIKFIEFALNTSDFFMLVYCKKKHEGFKRSMKTIKRGLSDLKVMSQFRFSWADTIMSPYCGFEYQVCFYRSDSSALHHLLSAKSLFEWDWPLLPQDLCFYRMSHCWFYSVSHERMAIVTAPTQQDITFFKQLDIISNEKSYSIEKWSIEEKWLTDYLASANRCNQ